MFFECSGDLDISHNTPKNMLFCDRKNKEKIYHLCIDVFIDFDAILTSTLLKKSIKNNQENMLEKYSQKPSILGGFGSHLRSFGGRKIIIFIIFSEDRVQGGSSELPGTIWESFGSILGSLWGAFWDHFGTIVVPLWHL